MITVVKNGEVFTPEPIGRTDVLIDFSKLLKIGPVNLKGLDILGLEYEVIDASNCFVCPAFIDPHQHLLGGSGEEGLNTQTPMIFLSEIVQCGITTVVGVLGVDTTMKTVSGLLARVKGLKEDGLTTRMWTGGYNVPPTTAMGSIRKDIMYIDEIVGAGEVAISDERSLQQNPEELAKLVLDTHVGGLLSGKPGLTHFHVGEADSRLKPVFDLLNNFEIDAAWLYPTHVTRSEKLFDEALELVKKGGTIDTDTIVGNVHKWIKRFLESGVDRTKFTISSDSGASAPRTFLDQFRSCVLDHRIPFEVMLPFCTSNAADILRLSVNGRLKAGNDANVLVLSKSDLEVREVISMGKRMIAGGRLVAEEGFLRTTDRKFAIIGKKDEEQSLK